jgi:hypothetical protein
MYCGKYGFCYVNDERIWPIEDEKSQKIIIICERKEHNILKI